MNRFVVLAATIGAALLLIAPGAQGFKPYTHNYTGNQARADAADGHVTIAGREYPVPGQVAQALHDWPTYYNAGVVGPDGFPDLTMGQSVIHPVHTGQWLRYILNRAWATQDDPSYSPQEKSQVLAFAYGFMTHAAGDMWAHTLVNEQAKGVFPGVKEILTNSHDAEIAIRHIILEGYIGDATPGFDGNDDRTTLSDGDVSDDSSPGTGFDAPVRWIYETLVDPNAVGAPSTARGPLIGFFTGLKSSLQDFVSGSFSNDIAAVAQNFESSKAALDEVNEECSFPPNIIKCPIALAKLGITVIGDAFGAAVDAAEAVVKEGARLLLSSYVHAWIDDIDSGLHAWGELGLASTRALFDPQTRRDLQNEECASKGPETSVLRANCEDGIGAVDVLFDSTNDFVNNHLLSMLGAPDFVGVARGAIQDAMDTLGKALDVVLNPIAQPLAAIEDFAKEQIKQLVSDAIGIDVDQLNDFIKHPTSWLNVGSVSVALPGVGTQTLHLFETGQHAALDGYLHLPADHHEGLDISSHLADDVEFDPNTFAAVKNTITTAKLLLLAPDQLNLALHDMLVASGDIKASAPVNTYPAGSNVMWQPLHGSEPWLQLIDGDHSWRANGLPAFCDASVPGCGTTLTRAIPRSASGSGGESQLNAGNGEFPIWESCVLRPAFRTLYTDWENGAEQFPALGDDTSSDNATDPTAPTTSTGATANSYTSGGVTYVGKTNALRVSASDAVFTDSRLHLEYALHKDGTLAALAPGTNPQALSIPANGGDGVWKVDSRASDACAMGTVSTEQFVLDTTAPVITAGITPPGPQFDTASTTTVSYSADDGAGSGVASLSATLDGSAIPSGYLVDTFFLAPGSHTIVVSTVDNVGNAATSTITFEVHATAESLGKNVDRAFELGLITKQGTANSLGAKTAAALRSHQRGQHATEWNQLGAFINELEAQRGKSIDPVTADRFIAFAQDLIAQRG